MFLERKPSCYIINLLLNNSNNNMATLNTGDSNTMFFVYWCQAYMISESRGINE
jgi:hypothetical protein